MATPLPLFVRYTLLGGLTAGTKLGLLVLLPVTLGLPPWAAYAAGIACATILGFVLNAQRVFRVRPTTAMLARYLLSLSGFVVLDEALYLLLDEVLGLSPLWAGVGATVAIYLLKFMVYRHVVFVKLDPPHRDDDETHRG